MRVQLEYELIGSETARCFETARDEITDAGSTWCVLLLHSSRTCLLLACFGVVPLSSKFELRKRLPPRFGLDADGHFP